MRRAIRKYGIYNFHFEVLEKCETEDKVKRKEIEHISKLRTFGDGYNLTKGGEGNLGWKPSQETRNKIRQQAIGKIKHNRPIVIDNNWYPSIKEAAKALKVGYSGLVRKLAIQRRHGFTEFTLNPVYPPPKHTPESKAKISRANTGRKLSDKANKSISDKAKKRYKEQLHPMCKSVVIDSVEYSSIKHAAKQIGVNYSTLRWRLQRDTNNPSKPITVGAAES